RRPDGGRGLRGQGDTAPVPRDRRGAGGGTGHEARARRGQAGAGPAAEHARRRTHAAVRGRAAARSGPASRGRAGAGGGARHRGRHARAVRARAARGRGLRRRGHGGPARTPRAAARARARRGDRLGRQRGRRALRRPLRPGGGAAMKVLFLSEREVHALLEMPACVALMRQTLATLARGDALLPLRSMLRLPHGHGLLGLMPGYLGEPRAFGLKAVTVMPGNHGTEFDSHQGVVMLFGVEHGEPLAILDATAITEIRTAAVSGAATHALARPDAGDLAILGSGAQARSHLTAMAAVRSLRRVRVWSRTRASAERSGREQGGRHGLEIEVAADAAAAVRGADLVCTTTAAREPVLEGRWLAPGAHVNAVGACFAGTRELDGDAVARS